MESPRIPIRDSVPEAGRPRSVFARIRQAVAPSEAEWREEVRRRIRSKPGFFSSLSAEALQTVREHRGPDTLGGPAPKRSDP